MAASRWHADLYGQPVAWAAARLPAGQVEERRARGRSADIWAAAEQLAAYLAAG